MLSIIIKAAGVISPAALHIFSKLGWLIPFVYLWFIVQFAIPICPCAHYIWTSISNKESFYNPLYILYYIRSLLVYTHLIYIFIPILLVYCHFSQHCTYSKIPRNHTKWNCYSFNHILIQIYCLLSNFHCNSCIWFV